MTACNLACRTPESLSLASGGQAHLLVLHKERLLLVTETQLGLRQPIFLDEVDVALLQLRDEDVGGSDPGGDKLLEVVLEPRLLVARDFVKVSEREVAL